MEYMNFGDDEETTFRAITLNSKDIVPPRQLDWSILSSYGLETKLKNHIIRTHESNFKDDSLMRLYQIKEDVYQELLVEFLASFKFNKPEEDEFFNTTPSISFRLCGVPCHFSLMMFGIYMGLVDFDVDKALYKKVLDRSTIGAPRNYSRMGIWNEVTMISYDPTHSRGRSLKNPFYRLIHYLNEWTLLYSGHPNVLSEQHLIGLHYVLDIGTNWHIPYALALMFQKASRGEFVNLSGGQVVMRMAKIMRLLDVGVMARCKTPIPCKVKGLKFLLNSMILLRVKGNTFRLYKDHEINPKREEASTSTSSGHKPKRARKQEKDEAQPSLAKILKRINMLGKYCDSLNKMVAQVHKDNRTHYTTRFGQPTPITYMTYLPRSLTWEERIRQEEGDPMEEVFGEEDEEESDED